MASPATSAQVPRIGGQRAARSSPGRATPRPARKVGSAFLRSNLKRIKKRLDHAEHGGALLLGVNGICVIGHGSSKALSVVSALMIAHSAASHGVMEDLAALRPTVID